MVHAKYCLYKKKTAGGLIWYVRFWDEQRRKYTVVRSTGIRVRGKKGRRRSADDVAREMLDDIVFNPSEKTIPAYLESFWREDSVYAREWRVLRKAPLSKGYIRMSASLVKHHLKDFLGFQGRYLQDLNAGVIRDWMLWEAERGVSGVRINKALQAFRVAVHYALSRDEIRHDPFKNIVPAAVDTMEKGVLTEKEVRKLYNLETENKDGLLFVLFGLCGMRIGEVRGVQWADLTDNKIHIRHNWQDGEGLKIPKCKSEGTVPLPQLLKAKLGEPGEGFVFPSRENPEKPVSNGHVRNQFIRILEAIGISYEEQQKRNLSFHSLRHTFVTLGRIAGISDVEIRALARHRTLAITGRTHAMTERYTHTAQVINLAKAGEKLNTIFCSEK
jgi:integrase